MIKLINYGDMLAKTRAPLPKIKREKVFSQWAGLCGYCGIELNKDAFHVDHKIPVRNGGTNDYRNLVACCIPCHKNKTEEDRKESPYRRDKEEIIGQGSEIIKMSPDTSKYGGRSWLAI